MSPPVPQRLLVEDTAVLLIDMQERLLQAMPPSIQERHLHQAGVLLAGALALDLPIVVTEQYPQGLGPTAALLRDRHPAMEPVAKLSFSCLEDAGARAAIEATGRGTLLVAGMETHICVFQSVRDLTAADIEVHVMADACLSRRKLDYETGLTHSARSGAHISTVESALFELMGTAECESFRAISRLVR